MIFQIQLLYGDKWLVQEVIQKNPANNENFLILKITILLFEIEKFINQKQHY